MLADDHAAAQRDQPPGRRVSLGRVPLALPHGQRVPRVGRVGPVLDAPDDAALGHDLLPDITEAETALLGPVHRGGHAEGPGRFDEDRQPVRVEGLLALVAAGPAHDPLVGHGGRVVRLVDDHQVRPADPAGSVAHEAGHRLHGGDDDRCSVLAAAGLHAPDPDVRAVGAAPVAELGEQLAAVGQDQHMPAARGLFGGDHGDGVGLAQPGRPHQCHPGEAAPPGGPYGLDVS